MCVDYKELNSKIIKDTFPILVIEEFLDELCKTSWSTKLDHHQIRMTASDVPKTAFRTH